MTRDLKANLRSLQGFDALSDVSLDEIVRHTSVRAMRAGETIFCQGEPSPYFFGVLSGEVTIQRVSSDKRFPVKIVGIVSAGGLFGESSIFEESPRVAMASASKDGELLVIRGSEFRNWLKKSPEHAQPLLMSLLRMTTMRLHLTNQELSAVYGVGRILGSAKPFMDQLSSAMEFLKSSFDGLDDVVVYQRSPYWDEFVPVQSLPSMPDLPGVSVANALIHKVSTAGTLFAFEPKAFAMPLADFKLDWENRLAAVIIPLFDWEKSSQPLQGLLLLSSSKKAQAFAAEKQLLLTSVSNPLAEAFSRHGRLQDSEAKNRLQQSKQSFLK